MINTMEVAPEELPGLDLFQNCRLCLAKEKVSVDIFSEGHEIRLLYYKIVSCLPVHVTQDDKLPRKICMQCNEKVDNFYQFWTLTAKSQKTLLDWVEKKDLLPPAKIKTENVPPGEVLFKQEVPDYSDEDNDNDNDRYEDDNSEEDLEPSTVVKVCEETEETAGGTTPGPSAGTKIKLTEISESQEEEIDKNAGAVFTVKSKDLVAALEPDNFDEPRCKLCGVVSENSTMNYIHFVECKKRKDVQFECSICKRIYRLKRTFDTHLKRDHQIRLKDQKKIYECYYCNKRFNLRSRTTIVEHIRKHMDVKPYHCDLCGERFGLSETFYRHIKKKHLGIAIVERKQISCFICNKRFKTKEERDSHKKIHATESGLECHYCQKKLRSRQSMGRHITLVHMKPTNERSFVCDICGNGYIRKKSLTFHYKKVHKGGKPVCTICGKKVSDKKSLSIHMNTHTGAKHHCCDICGKSFTTANYLKVHIYCHTGETPHACHVCPKKFRQRSSYTLHYKNNHPGIVPPKKLYTLNNGV